MLDFPNEEKYSIAKPGKKTKTSFRGTISYCGEEMRKGYLISTTRFVCLYENDQIFLKKTLS
jgi:hypothetical protein